MIRELIFMAVCFGIFLAIAISIKLFKYVTRLENEKYGKPYVVGYTLTGEKMDDPFPYTKFGHAILRARNGDDAREKVLTKLLKKAYLKSQIKINRVSEDGDRAQRYWSLGSETRLLE